MDSWVDGCGVLEEKFRNFFWIGSKKVETYEFKFWVPNRLSKRDVFEFFVIGHNFWLVCKRVASAWTRCRPAFTNSAGVQGVQFVYRVFTSCTGCSHCIQGVHFVYRVFGLCTGCSRCLQVVHTVYRVFTSRTGCSNRSRPHSGRIILLSLLYLLSIHINQKARAANALGALRSCCIYFPKITPTLVYQSNPSKNHARNATIQDPVKGKTWRSLDLANQSHSNSISQNPPPATATPATSTNTTSSLHHNSLINNAPSSHYQRHDFKNRRSSSEPANEQKLLAHILTHTTHTNTLVMIDDAPPSSIKRPGDEFIDCLHQKNITKVSKKPFKGKIHLQSNTLCPLTFLSLCLSLFSTKN